MLDVSSRSESSFQFAWWREVSSESVPMIDQGGQEPRSGRVQTLAPAPRCLTTPRGGAAIDLLPSVGGVLIKLTEKEKLDTKHSN